MLTHTFLRFWQNERKGNLGAFKEIVLQCNLELVNVFIGEFLYQARKSESEQEKN